MAQQEVFSHEGKIYYEFSHLYERIFTGVLGPRICSTIRTLGLPAGSRVLEVGVGTGLSLPAYAPDVQVLGIDLAPEMLAQAQQKVDENGWKHITLRQMDALNLDLPDGHFDYVMAFHIVSVVPDTERLIREMLRVTRTGGTVVIINHFRSEKKWLAPLVDLLDPVTRRIGWRTTLRFDEVIQGFPLRIEQRFKTSPGSLFTVVVATKTESSSVTVEVEVPRVCGRPPWKPRRERRKRAVALAEGVRGSGAGKHGMGLRLFPKPRKEKQHAGRATRQTDERA
jgi:phosphatidylethanolamine/phosphatidyl-N-methylethanolamine N-methyltransferase